VSFLAAGERAAVTAKARVYRGRLLAPSDYLRLLELETVGEIAAYLAKTEAYGPYITEPSPETMHRGTWRRSSPPSLSWRRSLSAATSVRNEAPCSGHGASGSTWT
jgi:hypothetical protein